MIEWIANDIFNDALRFDGRQLVLGLANEFRLANEHREHGGSGDHHIIGGDDRGALVAGEFRIGLEAAGERDAQPRFMGAAFAGRNGIAIGIDETITAIPGDSPLHGAMAAGFFRLTGKHLARDLKILAERGAKIILEAAREMEDSLIRRRILRIEQ